ncbi:hypothetical protein VTI74DRAFT_4531 [Chaetomium olivicolor]
MLTHHQTRVRRVRSVGDFELVTFDTNEIGRLERVHPKAPTRRSTGPGRVDPSPGLGRSAGGQNRNPGRPPPDREPGPGIGDHGVSPEGFRCAKRRPFDDSASRIPKTGPRSSHTKRGYVRQFCVTELGSCYWTNCMSHNPVCSLVGGTSGLPADDGNILCPSFYVLLEIKSSENQRNHNR